ncbi:MAG TPA: heparan-alpha-glucosaminide N-acetyltransferase domain-containing protein [Bryobacteraceae bacterium]|nr:heparan-alpha-glucosaminide N-acetyltransferase domain-containing protein [Bryobacteraceae bacterium]
MNTPATQTRSRLASVDALRGLVMIIMALDHVREFFHRGAMSFSPEDLTRTTGVLFFTRWITHFCAPVFMFTTGLGAFFWYRRGRSKSELSGYLLRRGLWLVILDLTVLRFALNFSLVSGVVILNVLWGLGWSMIALALLVHLPTRVLALVSVLVIALHNLADPIQASQLGRAAWLWNVLHQLGVFSVGGVPVLAAYTLIPWIGVMSAGFCFGHILTLDEAERRRWLVRIGAGMTLAFLVVRAVNVYGDPQPWSTQVPGMTALSFVRTSKYPPSLDFLLMTLGPAILLLAWFDRVKWSRENPLLVFGRVPLFYFIVHIYVIHAAAIPLALATYGKAGFLRNVSPSLGGDPKLYPAGYGYDLWVVYVLWLAVVVALYLPCLWFARMKEQRKHAWLAYF